MHDLDLNTYKLPSRALDELAHWFGDIGSAFSAAAYTRQTGEARAVELKWRRRALRTSASMLATYIASGQSPEQATKTVSKITGLDEAAILSVLSRAAREGQALARARRNRRLMQLASLGWTDAELGVKYDLHRKSVNRIIARERRFARQNPQSISKERKAA